MRSKVSLRTCLGCGAKAPPSELVRFVLAGAEIARSGGGRDGRGAWLHPDEGCLDRALKKRAFPRAFRRPVEVDAGALRVQLTRSARKD